MPQEANRNYPPSDYKLSTLRASGVVPFSGTTHNSAAVLGFLTALYLIAPSATASFSTFVSRETVREELGLKAHLLSALGTSLGYSLMLLLPVVVTAIVIGIIQTKFLIHPTACVPRFRLHYSWFPLDLAQVKALSARAVISLLWSVLAGLCISAVVFNTIENSSLQATAIQTAEANVHLKICSSDRSFSAYCKEGWFIKKLEENAGHLRAVFFASVAFLFLVGAAARFIAVLQFQRDHAMSRQELEAEMREFEGPLEIRRSIVNLYREE